MNLLLDSAFSTFIHRVALGSVLLAHSIYLKLMVFSLPGTAQFFVSIGLPGIFAYLVFSIETVAGLALILGLYTRIAALLVIPVLLGATWVHIGNGWLFTNTGGGWEYPLILVVMAVVQAGLGDGKYSVGRLFVPQNYRVGQSG